MDKKNLIVPLDQSYTLYYHDVSNDNWEKDSYIKITTVSTLNDFVKLYNTLSNYTSGMFFLMKDPIFPLFEDDANLNGGFWTYKIAKKDMNKLWFDIAGRFVCNQLTKNPEHMKIINGLSISPKISNCILKIWNNDSKINQEKLLFKEDVQTILNTECHYRQHVENILNYKTSHKK